MARVTRWYDLIHVSMVIQWYDLIRETWYSTPDQVTIMIICIYQQIEHGYKLFISFFQQPVEQLH